LRELKATTRDRREIKIMASVEVYSSKHCGFCNSAKRLLLSKQAELTEIDVILHPTRRKEMISRAGGRTSVPQIFIDGSHVGGCDDLFALDKNGQLDGMLSAVSSVK